MITTVLALFSFIGGVSDVVPAVSDESDRNSAFGYIAAALTEGNIAAYATNGKVSSSQTRGYIK